MQAKPFLIDGQIVRSLLIFSFSESAVSAIDWLQQQPIQIALASALIGSVESLSAAEMEVAIALLQTKGFDAAVIFISHQRSPYKAAYLCYLAGIPLRISQSCEFGGGILTHCFNPPNSGDPHEALLQSIGFYS